MDGGELMVDYARASAVRIWTLLDSRSQRRKIVKGRTLEDSVDGKTQLEYVR